MIRNLLAAVMAVFLFSGCSFVSGAIGVAEQRGEEAFDQALETAEDTICRYSSVGSVMRRYGQNSAQAQAWLQLCLRGSGQATEIIEGLAAGLAAEE